MHTRTVDVYFFWGTSGCEPGAGEVLASFRSGRVTHDRGSQLTFWGTSPYAAAVEHLLTVDYPDADKVLLVMDKLNTHNIASRHQGFPPETFALAWSTGDPLTQHGIWLNITEVELAFMTRQCLD